MEDTQPMDGVDEERVLERVDRYLDALEAGREASLEELVRGLDAPERAAARAAALGGEYLMRLARGEDASLADYQARLEGERERARFARTLDDRRAALAALPAELAAGSLLDGRYEIRRELGEGGMGRVYAAHDRQLEREIAVKVLRAPLDPGQRAEWAERFVRESRTLARLGSPSIVAIHDLCRGEHDYIVMDLVAGLDLHEVVQRLRAATGGAPPASAEPLRAVVGRARESARPDLLGGPSHERCATRIARALALAVETAHAAGVVHRDIKPKNVLLQPGGEPVLLDFGLATSRSEQDLEGFLGTPEYLAPEQVEREASGQDPRTDVYQLGLVLYELVTLRPAFARRPGEGLAALFERVRLGALEPARAHAPGLSPTLAAILAMALARDPGARYPSARELREDLERALARRPPRHARLAPGHALALRARALLSSPLTWGLAALAVGGAAFALRERGWIPPSRVQAFQVQAGALDLLEPGQVLAVTGAALLGLDLLVEEPTWVYAFSVFGAGTERAQRLVRPLVPEPLDAALAPGHRPGRDAGALALAPGRHRIACASLRDPDPYEGLLLLACRREEPALERLQQAMHQRERTSGAPLRLADVDALADELQASTRGDPLSALDDAARASLLGEALAAGSGTEDGLWRRRGWASWDFLFAVRRTGH